MARTAEFTKPVKREAKKRSGDKCEAMGAMYGLPAGQRCNMPLSRGVQFDHIILEANSHDNSLENCAAVCIRCHEIKTRTHDIPTAAKTVRMQDKDQGIKGPSKFRKPPGFKFSWRTGRMEKIDV